jgi:hypothetical protein
MNKHYITSLFDEGLKTIGVKFGGIGKVYTYKTRDNFALGDHAVVDTPGNGLQIVEVFRVDEEPELDPDSVIDYKWIVCKVDLSAYHEQNEKDQLFLKQIAALQRKRHREQAKNALFEIMPELASLENPKEDI